MVTDLPIDATRRLIGRRIAEERERAGLSQVAFARDLDVSKRSVAGWEAGEVMPNAEVVASFERLGLDLLYVLTGRRGGALDDQESRLVSLYLRVPLGKRPALIGMAEALAVGMPLDDPRPAVLNTFHGQVGNVHAVHQGTITNTYKHAAAKPTPRKKAKPPP